MVDNLKDKLTEKTARKDSIIRELRSTYRHIYVVDKLKRAGIVPSEEAEDITFYVRQEVNSLIHKLAEIKKDKVVIDNTNSLSNLIIWSEGNTSTSKTLILVQQIYNEVKEKVDSCWNNAS